MNRQQGAARLRKRREAAIARHGKENLLHHTVDWPQVKSLRERWAADAESGRRRR